MFKNLAFAFLFGLVSTVAQAEVLPLATVQRCETEPNKMFEMVQEEYGEIPFLQGTTLVQAFPSLEWLNGDFYMTMNPDTRTFSIIVVDPQTGMECLWLGGQNAQPITGNGI